MHKSALALTVTLFATSAQAVGFNVQSAVGKTPQQVARVLAGYTAVQVRSDLMGGKPGSEWRYTNRRGDTIEVTFKGTKADRFYIVSDDFRSLNPANDYRKILGKFGLTNVPKPSSTWGPTQIWSNYKGFKQISITGNGPVVTGVIFEKTARD